MNPLLLLLIKNHPSYRSTSLAIGSGGALVVLAACLTNKMPFYSTYAAQSQLLSSTPAHGSAAVGMAAVAGLGLAATWPLTLPMCYWFGVKAIRQR